MKQLSIEDVIKILSRNKILFSCKIGDVGQDTMWEEVEFSMDDADEYCHFVFHLDLYTHGSNIESNCDGRFHKIYTEKEFLQLIKM